MYLTKLSLSVAPHFTHFLKLNFFLSQLRHGGFFFWFFFHFQRIVGTVGILPSFPSLFFFFVLFLILCWVSVAATQTGFFLFSLFGYT